jgi:hypothetical protein
MIRLKLLAGVLAVVGVAWWASLACPVQSAGQVEKAKAAKPGAFVHTVVFHVKKDAPKDEIAALISDAHELLATIPSVRELRVGRPAEKGTPDLAKKDFQVGLLVLFDDFAGLQTYLDHPQHQKYVQKHLNHIEPEKLLVYDFVDQKR